MHLRSCLSLPVVLALTLLAAPARAAPWFDAAENAHEELFADGDIDEEDHLAMHLGRAQAGVGDAHGESWVSLGGFARQLRTGRNDLGAILVVGLALDRVTAGPVHRIADPPRPGPPAPPAPAPPPHPQVAAAVSAPAVPALSARLAHVCVAAAWRSSGLGEDDARIDAIVARSRASALLPETRMRAMRLLTDSARATTLATTDGTNTYDAAGANLVLELRLTWRLDRLVFAGDEPALERLRLERQDARARLATRTLEVLFAWQRARIDLAQTVEGSRERVEADLRVAEAEATLDVLTGGWFSQRAESAGAD
jgi:hypothetical protein